MTAPILAAATPDALRREVIIVNPQGLHLRPAAAFAKLAQQYTSAVFVIHNDQRVNGKSPMEMLLLAAEPGSRLVVEVTGSDADQALNPLADILAATGGEDQPD